MNWIFTTLLAQSLYTVTNFIDKYIVSNEVKENDGILVFGTITGFIMGTFFWIITGFPILPIQDAILLIISGTILICASYVYFKALALEEASKVIILFQITPIFVLILATIFLKETIVLNQIIGFFIILGSAIGIYLKKSDNIFKLSKAFWLVMIVDLLWSISAITVKYAINATSFSSILAYESWGLALGGSLLFILIPKIRNSFFNIINSVPKKVIGIMFSSEAIFVLAKSIGFYSYSIGPTALVSVVGNTQVFFGIIYGYLLTILLPKFFKEDISKESVFLKLIWGSLMIVGIYLVGK